MVWCNDFPILSVLRVLCTSRTNHVMKHHRISLFLVGLMLGLVSVGNAQITGYTAELDTAFGDIPSSDPLAELAYHGVYNIYANFTSPEDVLGSLYADVVALGTAPMGIDAPCGCFNPTSSTMLIEGNNSETTIGFFPEFAYDSFWTIGLADFFDEGVEPQLVSVETPNDLCEGFTINDGLIYALGTEATGWPANMIAGDDLKILVARVTTCGDFSLHACAQVFVGSLQDSVQQWCPDEPLFVEHVILGCTDENACNYNAQANQDDASCIFVNATCDDMNELTVGDVYQDDCDCQGYSCYDPFACNFSTAGIQDDDLCSYVSQYGIVGNTDPYSATLHEYTYTETPGSTYEWTVQGGSVTDGDGTSILSVVWTDEGNGSVCVVETTADGCVGQEVCLDVLVRLSSVQELPQGQFEVYPNPARDWLQLQWTGPVLNNARVVLRDAAGRVVLSQQVAEQEALDVSSFGAGAYVLEFSVPEFGSIQRQVVIQ